MTNKYQLIKDETVIAEADIHYFSIIPHIFLLFLGIGFITIIIAAFRMLTTKLIISNKRLRGKVGIIRNTFVDSPLSKINDVTVEQGLLGRIFNYGKVIITTSNTTYNFRYIANPHHLKHVLCQQIDLFDEIRMINQLSFFQAKTKV